MREDNMEKLEEMFPDGFMIVYSVNDQAALYANPKGNTLVAYFAEIVKNIFYKAKADAKKRKDGEENI